MWGLWKYIKFPSLTMEGKFDVKPQIVYWTFCASPQSQALVHGLGNESSLHCHFHNMFQSSSLSLAPMCNNCTLKVIKYYNIWNQEEIQLKSSLSILLTKLKGQVFIFFLCTLQGLK